MKAADDIERAPEASDNAHNPQQLLRQLRYFPRHRLTYVENPKVGSGSILYSLTHSGAARRGGRPYGWWRHAYRHIRDGDCESVLKSEFFSVVRNPYARLLSGYYGKVAHAGPAWRKMCGSFGLSAGPAPSLSEFLIRLQDLNPETVNRHFRPQHLILSHNVIPLDFLGRLERMEEVVEWLTKRGIVFRPTTGNATDAPARVASLTEDDAERIRRYYASDFEIYGYSFDPQVQPAVRDATVIADRAVLRKYLIAAVD